MDGNKRGKRPPRYPVNPKRVLMVTSTLSCGGSERQMLATCEGLFRRGYEIEIFELAGLPRGEFSFQSEFMALGIASSQAADYDAVATDQNESSNFHDLEQFRPILEHLSVVRLGWSLDRAIRNFGPAVVHCWSNITNVIGGFVATALGVPRIVLGHRNVPAFRMNLPAWHLYRQAYQILMLNPNVVQFNNSIANAMEFETWLGVPRGAVSIIYNGLLPGSIRVRAGEEIRQCRRAFAVPDGAPVVGAVMRFASEKDPDLWLDTAARIAAARPDVYFLVAGYGDLAARAAARVEALGLQQRFVLSGPTKDVGAVYAAMDVFLMTSQFEGVPNALIEAQAAGVPIVAPIIGGTSEAFIDGTTGMLVPDRSADKLSDAVLSVLADSRWRQRSALHGPAFVAQRFDAATMIDKTIAIYGKSPLSIPQRMRQIYARLKSPLEYYREKRAASGRTPVEAKGLKRAGDSADSDHPSSANAE